MRETRFARAKCRKCGSVQKPTVDFGRKAVPYREYCERIVEEYYPNYFDLCCECGAIAVFDLLSVIDKPEE